MLVRLTPNLVVNDLTVKLAQSTKTGDNLFKLRVTFLDDSYVEETDCPWTYIDFALTALGGEGPV